MYYVIYVDRQGNEHSEEFNTRDSAIRYYKANLRNMAYGYISDDEALVTAESVKIAFEEELAERKQNMLNLW